MRLALFVIVLVINLIALSQQNYCSLWQAGMYWTYYVEVYEMSNKQVLREVAETTFLAIKGVELLGTETWAVAVISYGAPLLLIIYTQECLRPYMRWPLPVEFIPAIAEAGPQRGLFMGLARKGPFDQGPTFQVISTGIEIEIMERETSTVSTPYGTPYEAIAVRYSAKVGQRQREGIAWWASQAGWWVKAEGYEFGESGIPLYYSLTLKKHGVLTFEELNSKLVEAFKYTMRQYPEIAETLREIFEHLQITIPNT